MWPLGSKPISVAFGQIRQVSETKKCELKTEEKNCERILVIVKKAVISQVREARLEKVVRKNGIREETRVDHKCTNNLQGFDQKKPSSPRGGSGIARIGDSITSTQEKHTQCGIWPSQQRLST